MSRSVQLAESPLLPTQSAGRLFMGAVKMTTVAPFISQSFHFCRVWNFSLCKLKGGNAISIFPVFGTIGYKNEPTTKKKNE